MNRHILRHTFLMANLGLFLAIFQNCSKVSFSVDPNANNRLNGLPCELIVSQTTTKLKILFMVDASGSTIGNDGTDPDKSFRTNTIQSFLDRFGTKPNFSYAFGMFADSGSMYDISSMGFSANAALSFGGASSLSSALGVFRSLTLSPQGRTNYREAFTTVASAIVKEEVAHPREYGYAVVFMSDGKPNPAESETGIKNIVQDLLRKVEMQGSATTVSSVYFGPPTDTEAITNVQIVATEGNGQFVDTNTLGGADLSIADIVTLPGQSCTSVQ